MAIQVSLDGANRETCDAIRGKGVFDAAIEAVKLLAATSIPTSINTVLTTQNAGEIPAMHELARSLGVSLRVSRFRPSGRGADNWEDLRPTPTQLLAFSDWLAKSGDVRTGDSFFSLTTQERQGLGLNLCGAAKLTCCVGPTGNMYPCAFLQSDRFKAGSLRDSTFQEIWDSSEIYESFRQPAHPFLRGVPALRPVPRRLSGRGLAPEKRHQRRRSRVPRALRDLHRRQAGRQGRLIDASCAMSRRLISPHTSLRNK